MSEASKSTDLIDLSCIESWPASLLEVLDHHHHVLRTWEENFAKPPKDRTGFGDSGLDRINAPARAYDLAIRAVCDALRPFAVRGWHCTRLTDWEVEAIIADGLALPDAAMLARRIDRLVDDGALAPGTAARLKAENQSDDDNRTGRVWFCFFPPRLAGQRGIERFFRHWGGEALYNSHERDPVTSPALRAVGAPALVAADVPIALLESPLRTAFAVARRFVVSRGCATQEPIEHEDFITHVLPATCVRRVIRFPDPDFLALTGSDNWKEPLA